MKWQNETGAQIHRTQLDLKEKEANEGTTFAMGGRLHETGQDVVTSLLRLLKIKHRILIVSHHIASYRIISPSLVGGFNPSEKYESQLG